ncbi:hypothetical protein Taro_019545, partial [Colocasia esculenta]|nr:hypothetical protein [Colocasia esculenta]
QLDLLSVTARLRGGTVVLRLCGVEVELCSIEVVWFPVKLVAYRPVIVMVCLVANETLWGQGFTIGMDCNGIVADLDH